MSRVRFPGFLTGTCGRQSLVVSRQSSVVRRRKHEQQQSKLVRSEKKLTHARDGGFPTPTSAGKKTRKDEAWVTAERRRLDMPALTEEEKAKRGWRPAAARLSLPFSPPAAAAGEIERL